VTVGAQRYYIVNQDDCDPSAKSTGKIDRALLSRYFTEQVGKFPSEGGVLDYETPFDEWIKKGPESERCRIAIDSMVAAGGVAEGSCETATSAQPRIVEVNGSLSLQVSPPHPPNQTDSSLVEETQPSSAPFLTVLRQAVGTRPLLAHGDGARD
jgi:hypothetical protein